MPLDSSESFLSQKWLYHFRISGLGGFIAFNIP
jgi:hypothetical protein